MIEAATVNAISMIMFLRAITKIDEAVDTAIARMDEEEQAGQATFRSLILLLCSMPSITILSATIILAKIGRDMSGFPTPAGVVRDVTGPERERRQTSILAPAQGCSLAQDHPRSVRLGSNAKEGQ